MMMTRTARADARDRMRAGTIAGRIATTAAQGAMTTVPAEMTVRFHRLAEAGMAPAGRTNTRNSEGTTVPADARIQRTENKRYK